MSKQKMSAEDKKMVNGLFWNSFLLEASITTKGSRPWASPWVCGRRSNVSIRQKRDRQKH